MTLALSSRVSAQVYSINTLAGTPGLAGYVDDTGSAARFNNPAAIAVDATGNVFVADANPVLRKISPTGAVTTVASLPSAAAGIALDEVGNAYLTDRNFHVIRRVSSTGVTTVFAGQSGTSGNADGPSDAARFRNPQGIARDAAGNLFVADTGNHTIRKITPAGVVSTIAGLAGLSGSQDGAGAFARFYSPAGLAVDGNGNVYIADSSNHTIRQYSSAGNVSTLAGLPGNSYYSNSSAIDGTGGSARFSNPQGIVFTSGGFLLVSDAGGYAVRRITTGGVVTTVAGRPGVYGSTDGLAGDARFYSPRGLAVDASGNIYIADADNHIVRKGALLLVPRFSAQPLNQSVDAGGSANFSVTATGSATLTYQWQRLPSGAGAFVTLADSASYAGTATATLTINAATAAMHGDQFRCVVTNEVGSVTSDAATLAVAELPAITSSNSAAFYVGQAGKFTFTGTGAPKPTWSASSGSFPSWATLNAVTGALTGIPTTTDGAPFSFTVTATNPTGTASQVFSLSVQPAPVLASASISGNARRVVAKGGSLQLGVSVSAGTGPFTYQWKHNGLRIPGATGANYTIAAAGQRDGGYYQVVVTNAAGSTTSGAAFVIVTHASVEVIGWGSTPSVPSGLGNAVAVSAGYDHDLALLSDGTVVGWGSNSYAQATSPGLGNVVSVAAGYLFSVALKADGTVVAWGYAGSGKTTVPPGLSGVVAIAAGTDHALALKGDGTVVAWGYTGYSQTSVPAGLTGVVAIAASSNHSMALREDGTVITWGSSAESVPSSLFGVLAIASSGNTDFALKTDGSVATWGSTSNGMAAPTGLSGVVGISAASDQAIALKSDGTIAVWGTSEYAPPSGLREVLASSLYASNRLLLRDSSGDTAPTVVSSPVGLSANLGEKVSFAVTATAGTARINYQWYKDGSAIAGATGPNLSIDGVSASSVGSYHVVVSTALGSATSGSASLAVNASPVVSGTTHGRYLVAKRDSLTLVLDSKIAAGAAVQWRRNGLMIPGATSRSLTIVDAGRRDAGYYQAVYDEGTGPVVSGAIFVQIASSKTQVLGWGNSSYLNIPINLGDAISVLSRGSKNLVLKADGTVVQWGGSYSTTGMPTGLGDVVAIAATTSSTLALRSNGTVVAWSDYPYNTAPGVPSGLADVVAIAAGSAHYLALKGDGTVVAWGSTDYGATSVPYGLDHVIGIAAGNGTSFALRSDGTVAGWGNSSNGLSTVPSGLSDVAAISAVGNLAAAIRKNGSVVVWGYSYGGITPVPADLADVTSIAIGDSHVVALKSDNTVVAWGSNSNGQITPPPGLGSVLSAAAGTSQSLVVRDASADTPPIISSQPGNVSAYALQNVTLSVSASAGTAPLFYQWRKAGVPITGGTGPSLNLHSVTTADAASYDVVIANYLGTAISEPAVLTVSSTPAVSVSPAGRRLLSAGQTLSLSGTVALAGTPSYQWLRNGLPIPGATSATLTKANIAFGDSGVYRLVATNAAGPAVSKPVFVLVDALAELRGWGANDSGQTSTPAGITRPVAIAAGYYHSLALESDGTLLAWGSNSDGQCAVPTDLTEVVAVAAGDRFSMALLANGSVVTWGRINYTPAEATDVVAISASPRTGIAMALRSDGRVVAWDSSALRTDTPADLSDVVAMAAASSFYVALKSDGTVVQWNNNAYGTSSLSGTGLKGVVAIAAGYDYVLALKSDGTVVSWGSSSSGPPAVPGGLTDVKAVAVADSTNFALRANGTITAWNSSSYYNSSGLVSGVQTLAPVVAIAAGMVHSLALRDPSGDAVPVITTQPTDATVTSGQSLTLRVDVTGTPPPTFQWYRNGSPIYNATASTYLVSNTSPGDAGNYSVTVSNGKGSVTSNTVMVVIGPALNQRGLLVSFTRADTGRGIVGSFTIEGTSQKQILIRGLGPSLAALGTQDALADPILRVISQNGGIVASNDDWSSAGNASLMTSVAPQLGAFTLPSGSKDAAILQYFGPGTYQVMLTANGEASGVGMLQIYDADSYPRMAYVATNAFAGRGSQVLIQGISLSGAPAGRSYLIRAVGPTLGGAAAMADPLLKVFNSAGATVAMNDDWGGNASLASLAAKVGAAPLPADSKDAAVEFVPTGVGPYSAQVSPATGSGGEVLVEIFEYDTSRASSLSAAIVAQPKDAMVFPGTTARFGVIAVGLPAPTFQWLKQGTPIPGATGSILELPSVSTGDAGGYSVVVTNSGSSMTSAVARLDVVSQLATHAVVGPGYVAGSTVTLTNTLNYTGTAAGLGWQVVLPDGWSYAGGAGDEGDVKPAVGATGTLEWAWTEPPANPVKFTYTLNVPSGDSDPVSLTATAFVQVAGSSVSVAVQPQPLTIEAAPPYHSADLGHDGRIDLTDLLRVIELYNTREGTVRTGQYSMKAGTDDGYVAGGDGDPVTLYHSADINRDAKFSLTELLRVIELYNYRSGTVRTGQYHVFAGTEDGFAVGP